MTVGIDLVVGMLGTLRAGASYVPLDPEYPPARQAVMLADAAPRALLTQTGRRDQLPDTEVPVLRPRWGHR